MHSFVTYVIQKGYYVRGQLAPVDAATPTEVAFVFFILLWYTTKQ